MSYFVFSSLIKPHKYSTKRKHCPHGPIATITNDSQVKTYMDNSNGVRNINSNAYNKVKYNFFKLESKFSSLLALISLFSSNIRCLPVATVATSIWNHQHHNRKTASPLRRSKGTVPKAISSYRRQQKGNRPDILEALFTILAVVHIHGREVSILTDRVRRTVWVLKGLRRRCSKG